MGKTYTCLFCKLKFDTDEVEWERYGTRYAHTKCVLKHKEKEQLKEERKKNKTEAPKKKRSKNIRKCYYCGGDVDITTEKFSKVHSNRYAHRDCHLKNYTPDEEYIPKIYEYLKSIHFNYNYTQCDKQRVNFIKTMGYSNEEIYLTLKYMYSIKKLSPERSEGRIGLVPYLKEEAVAYYHNIEKKQEEIGLAVEKQLEKGVKVIRVLAPEKPIDKGYRDLDSIGDD